jgi:hypothetical protein
MKIVLELEDVRFATTVLPPLGSVRWMIVTVGGKQFNVRREMNQEMLYYGDRDAYQDQIDAYLIREMESMLAKMFRDAAAAVPEGEMKIRDDHA